MKVTIKTKSLLHDTLGRLSAGDVVELQDQQAESFIASGWAEPYQTKVVKLEPEVPKAKKAKA